MKANVVFSGIQSSLINRMEYVWSSEEDPFKMKAEGHLRVTFQNGSRYIYENVPLIIVMNIAASDSTGESFTSLIKGNGYSFYKESESPFR